MGGETIQCLHPDPGKSNKRITSAVYQTVKSEILLVLASKSLTHSELLRALNERLEGKISGNINWYGETVKLDLEARGLITRDGSKPARYSHT